MKREIISTTKLAKICGVSQGTVDRALNNRKGINPETKERILRVAKEYGYRPNQHARCMNGGRSMLIGIVIFDFDNEYFSDLVTEIERRCSEMGYYAIVMLTHKDKEKERQCLENLYYMAVDGIVLCPVNEGEEYEEFLHSLSCPIVTVGNKLKTLPYAGIDNKRAMYDATKYVMEKGYEYLVYVMPSLLENENSYSQSERLAGFKNAVGDLLHDIQIREFDMPKTDKRVAVICASDSYALRSLRYIIDENCGVIGFDNLRIVEKMNLKLDSVSQDNAKTANNAIDFLLFGKKISGYIPHSIIERGSVVEAM